MGKGAREKTLEIARNLKAEGLIAELTGLNLIDLEKG